MELFDTHFVEFGQVLAAHCTCTRTRAQSGGMNWAPYQFSHV